MARIYDIGPFRLDADIGALTREGTPVMLGARAVAVLTVLVEHAQQFLAKERLIDAAWPGVIVEEGNLPVQVHAIRRVLAQAPGGSQWIETLAKRGYRFVGPVTPVAAGALDVAESPRSNLPEAVTSFVGRERDLVEIKRLLATKRLITVVGIGGIGKTRLALQAGSEVTGAYRDGVWLVDLGSLRDGALAAGTVAQTLGVQERAGQPLTTALGAQLRSAQLLLILDNCEHLPGACAALVDALLKGTSQTTIIATSREPLRVAGEQIYSLQPLSLPEAGSTVDALQRSEAVQLLVERLRQQLPDFELTAKRAPAVTELCIHLDGIPLALELAAARARSLSIEQINARLGDRFRLLTSGARAALPRQRTLRAALDWSHDLLGDDERLVLRRLAIFPGSFTVEAASSVAAHARIDELAVVDLLSQLVARSLVIADTSAGATRYRLLETTRAYAQEKLCEADELAETAHRHGVHYRTFFAQAPADFLRLPDNRLREVYVPELDHVRAALDWAFGPDGDAAIGIALAGTSGPLWGTLGLFAEGARRMEAAIDRIQQETPESQQALLWRQLGRLVDEAPRRARPAFERAAELYRRVDDRLGLAHTLLQLGKVLAFMGCFDEAATRLGEAHELLDNAAPPWLWALHSFNTGFLKNITGDLAGARIHYERSRALFLEAGDDFTALAAFGNLANVMWSLGDLEAAKAAYHEQLAIARVSPMRTKRFLGYALGNLAGVLIERGELDEALAAGREALPLLLEDGTAWIFVSHFALLAALAGNPRNAARLAGYVDFTWGAQQAACPPNEVRLRERVREALHAQLPADDLERLRGEGARLTELEACRLALEG
jgi:predicted ATPase/DNA-binding winged helix-turn-helix (wHTH) protein